MVEIRKQSGTITYREFEVLKLLAKGYITKEISLLLNINSETVTTHRKNLLKKFKVKNCAELIYVVET